jgi:hypothetical protein
MPTSSTKPASKTLNQPASEHSRASYRHVSCFVDWNSQLLRTGIDSESAPVDAARAAFNYVTRRVARCLAIADKDAKFQVNLRLYHGWRKGYEPTSNLKAVRQVISQTDFVSLSVKPTVVFSGEIGFGDCLIAALPSRMHAKLAIHLPNTLRSRGDLGWEEKMVDTAMAADMVVRAYQERADWVVLVTEDDDLVPALFAVEAIIDARSARALLLSSRALGGKFLNLSDLQVTGATS